jgi:hypothetical protein
VRKFFKYKYLRLATVCLAPIFITLCIFNAERVRLEIHPLIDTDGSIAIPKEPLEALSNPLNLDIKLLKYNTTIYNDVTYTIKGDVKEYEHKVEIYFKYNKSNQEKIKMRYKEPNIIFLNITRLESLSKINDLYYLPNINIKPEVLNDGNKELILNYKIGGSLIINMEMNYFSIISIFIAVLLLEGIVIQSWIGLCQFIKWEF